MSLTGNGTTYLRKKVAYTQKRYRAMPALTETFKDSFAPFMGISTIASHSESDCFEIPRISLPSTSARGVSFATSNENRGIERGSCSTATIMQPFFLSIFTAEENVAVFSQGTVFSAPRDTLVKSLRGSPNLSVGVGV